jgi:hypothetical protein
LLVGPYIADEFGMGIWGLVAYSILTITNTTAHALPNTHSCAVELSENQKPLPRKAAIKATRIYRGPVIPSGVVPGYKSVFNGDVHLLPNGNILGVFRMARTGYEKVPSVNDRGYILSPYISDAGVFLSRDNGRSWDFIKIISATNDGLSEHISSLEREANSLSKNSKDYDYANRALVSLRKIEKSNLLFNVVEDPRFMSIQDASGNLKTYLFVTDVPPELLRGLTDFAKDKTYQMGAFEIEIDSQNNIEIKSYRVFGPPENKDTWVLNVQHDALQKQQMQALYKYLKFDLGRADYAIIVATRTQGQVQLIPFASIDDLWKVTKAQWQQISTNPELFTTILKPDGVKYKSLGNNDQPFAIKVAGYEKYYWHFYHKTRNSRRLEYETWVEILNESGIPVFRMPSPHQTPQSSYEVSGDIGWVVFNSGNIQVSNSIYHINGVADTAVAISVTEEKQLLHEILRHPVLEILQK